MSIPQGRNGYVTIGGTTYPVYNWQMQNPRNLQAPLPVGNGWSTNFAEGLQTTRFTASMMVRRKSTEVLALAFWNLFLSRTWAGGFDDTAASTIVGSNAKRTYTLANAKAESFSLTIRKGMPVGLSVVFVAPGIPTMATVTPAAYAPVDATAPLMEYDTSYGGITGSIYGLELTFANNHLANGPLNQTKNLSSWDAGVWTCGATFTVAAADSGTEPFADAAQVTVTLNGGAGATRVLTLTAVTPNNPRDVSVDTGQVFIPYNCLVQGNGTTAPLVVA